MTLKSDIWMVSSRILFHSIVLSIVTACSWTLLNTFLLPFIALAILLVLSLIELTKIIVEFSHSRKLNTDGSVTIGNKDFTAEEMRRVQFTVLWFGIYRIYIRSSTARLSFLRYVTKKKFERIKEWAETHQYGTRKINKRNLWDKLPDYIPGDLP